MAGVMEEWVDVFEQTQGRSYRAGVTEPRPTALYIQRLTPEDIEQMRVRARATFERGRADSLFARGEKPGPDWTLGELLTYESHAYDYADVLWEEWVERGRRPEDTNPVGAPRGWLTALLEAQEATRYVDTARWRQAVENHRWLQWDRQAGMTDDQWWEAMRMVAALRWKIDCRSGELMRAAGLGSTELAIRARGDLSYRPAAG